MERNINGKEHDNDDLLNNFKLEGEHFNWKANMKKKEYNNNKLRFEGENFNFKADIKAKEYNQNNISRFEEEGDFNWK